MSDNFGHVVHSSMWRETAAADDPFAADVCRAGGYDVYGDLLGKASYVDYLYLLFKGERPTPAQARALTALAIGLANPGPRDPSVHAAMAAGVTGNPAASTLMAAIAAGAGSAGGAREVLLAMQGWEQCGTELATWQAWLAAPQAEARPAFWPATDHAPGFALHGVSCAKPVLQLLDELCAILPGGDLAWLAVHRLTLEAAAGIPLALTGVAAAALRALGFTPQDGEMLALMLRLPGAAAHALEQSRQGFRQFPFFDLDLQDDPGPVVPKEQP